MFIANGPPGLTWRNMLFGKTPRFYSQGDPIPLKNQPDLSSPYLELAEPFDKETGEPYFTLYVHEHGNLTHLSLTSLEKPGTNYRLLVNATIPGGEVFSSPTKLTIDTCALQMAKLLGVFDACQSRSDETR